MIFRQLYEPDSSTYTYLLGCPKTRQAVLIDPALDTVERDLKVLEELGLTLAWTVDTHHHADHLTGASVLRDRTGCKVAYPAVEMPACADLGLREGEPFTVGSVTLHPLFTPGHTSHHHCYRVDTDTHTLLFTGDALLIDACGRTDFQSGDATTLYRSVHDKLFSLPDDTIVYPAHDYEGRYISTIAQEKKRNPRLGGGRSETEFVAIMDGLDLPYPRKIDFAVPGNEQCGKCPPDVPEEYRRPCDLHDQG
ncbi:MAG: MBL fold metallo-hydrolase [Gammaproteobacteria bacterium]|nr:MBL fold metallo-hydrolase [Gammaproteobacteria bacterium]